MTVMTLMIESKIVSKFVLLLMLLASECTKLYSREGGNKWCEINETITGEKVQTETWK